MQPLLNRAALRPLLLTVVHCSAQALQPLRLLLLSCTAVVAEGTAAASTVSSFLHDESVVQAPCSGCTCRNIVVIQSR